MHDDSRVPNAEQQQKLCNMLHLVLVDIRALAASGQAARASDLADAFHNLPHEMWRDYFSISFFREAFLVPYATKWSGGWDYCGMLDEVERLG